MAGTAAKERWVVVSHGSGTTTCAWRSPPPLEHVYRRYPDVLGQGTKQSPLRQVRGAGVQVHCLACKRPGRVVRTEWRWPADEVSEEAVAAAFEGRAGA